MRSQLDPAESLLRYICEGSTDAAGQAPVAVQAAATDSFQRCLVITRACVAGSSILAVPWPHALTAEGSMQQLRYYEARGRGLLPRGIQSVAELLESADSNLLPKASAWVLLLALHLLCQLRDPRSRWAKYVKLLPAPPGSRISSVCSAGPPATDLLLFSTEELDRLGNPALALTVRRERLRLTRLHAHLFGQRSPKDAAREPEISQDSFVWAHCLVRSRALELTANQAAGAAFHERCMLPVIDLCNHDGVHASCRLSVRLTPTGLPRAVDLVATRDLEAGSELSLDYGSRPMRDMLRGYGFTPQHAAMTDPSEVYEETGEACETLIVQGSGKGSHFQLREVKVLGNPGAHPLLELAGQATICYIVQDEAVVGADNWHEAPRLSLEILNDSQTSRAVSHGDTQLHQDGGDTLGISFGGRSAPTLPPDAERACVLRLFGLCRELQDALPVSCPPHSVARADSCTMADATSAHSGHDSGTFGSAVVGECIENAAVPGIPEAKHNCECFMSSEAAPCSVQGLGTRASPAHLVECESVNAASVLQDSWRTRAHAQMAASYCMQRRLLLQRVAADLDCQALLVSGQ